MNRCTHISNQVPGSVPLLDPADGDANPEFALLRPVKQCDSQVRRLPRPAEAVARPSLGFGTRSIPGSLVRLAPLALGVMFLASGCSDGALGGGARIAPSVTILVDDSGEEGGGAEEVVEVAGYGTLTGHVVLEGNLPTVAPNLPAGTLKDPAICIRDEIPNDRVVVDPASKGIEHVFVFLPRKPPGTPADLAAPPAVPVTFDQKVCTFLPHALVLRAGQELRILNSDGTVHNTHLNGQMNGDFNTAVAAHETEGVAYTYARGERTPVRVVCDFHPWMLAWHLPLDHPYGATTDKDGAFTIENMPAGTYQFAIYHEGHKLMDYEVTIEPDQTTTIEIPVPGDLLVAGVDPGQLRTVVLSSLPQSQELEP